ncbi:MAG: hypothetical protein JRN67_05645 [Nitrososphaerota archaeon]|nr:hypothetical protein [Nitrososphaerota archaeon]
MNDGRQANPDIFFGKEEKDRLFFCTEECRLRYGLIGVSKVAMAEIEVRKQAELNQRRMKSDED